MSATSEQASNSDAYPAPENTYHWSFTVEESLRIILSNPRGEIQVTSWDRPEVEISAIKQPDNPARSRVTRVEAEQQGNCISVRTITEPISRLVEQGFLRGVATDVIQALADIINLGVPAAISLTVHAPRHAELEINTVGSTTSVSGFDGTTRVRSVSGDVTLSNVSGYANINSVNGGQIGRGLSGRVTANTISGHVTLSGQINDLRAKAVSGSVEYAGPLTDGGHYLLNTVSGSASLYLPANSRASFSAQGVSLGVQSDLPGLTARESRSPGNNQWSGQLNGGGARVQFQTVSGTLYLRELREPSARPAIPFQPAAPAEPASPPEPPTAPKASPEPAPTESEQLRILGELERGEIGVDEALKRLEEMKRRPDGTAG